MALIRGLKPPVLGGLFSQCMRARANRKSNNGFDAVFAQAQLHCDNKPQQIGLNHDYNMPFSISLRDC